MTSNGTTSKAFSITSIALMAAVICVLGPLAIPVGPVPISLVPLAIFLSVYILGTKRGTAAVLIYLLIGAVGVPVFSGFAGGFGKIAGPTGGYLLGYIFAALIAGWFIHRFNDNVVIQFLGMLLGLIVLYAFGTAWLSISAGMDIKAAIAAGVFPFVVFDIAKIIIAILLGRTIKRRVPSLSQV